MFVIDYLGNKITKRKAGSVNDSSESSDCKNSANLGVRRSSRASIARSLRRASEGMHHRADQHSVQPPPDVGALTSGDRSPRTEAAQPQPTVGSIQTPHADSQPQAHPDQSAIDIKERLSKFVSEESKDSGYQHERASLLATERSLNWSASALSRASPAEVRANSILLNIREHERINLFGNMPGEAIPGSETRDLGGRFLINKERIDKSDVLTIAQKMPKGAHLHLHFNTELPPEVLFVWARDQVADTMVVRSTRPLLTASDFSKAEIVFNVLPTSTPMGNIFASDYNPKWRDPSAHCWMNWITFRRQFLSVAGADVKIHERSVDNLDLAECWAREKMVMTPQGTYHEMQTTNGAWACFNIGTRAFKGLLNYEGAYRMYIGYAIDSMIRDKVLYAELRPMLLDKFIPSNDGQRQLGHADQMRIICEEVARKQDVLKAQGRIKDFPFGLKIIYCTPRSIPQAKMQSELEDCIRLKLQFPDLICGFDLVGAEDRPNHIGFYAEQLVAFTRTCRDLHIEIPFMFHAGESLLDTGGSHDPEKSNLYDALLLNAKRIGHGYSLLRHPMLVEKYRKHDICLELCPISNELLHLCGNVRQHIFPELLAAGLHCTLNADNPSLFRGSTMDSSSLSYEFYQVMVGDTRMTLHGWKQLVEWSVQHSCLSPADKAVANQILAERWELFCQWVVDEYGPAAEKLPQFF